MKDRIPKYPGRVTLTPVEGQANTFDMVRADEPEQEGTPLNKATLLSDETAALFGLGEDATMNNVLASIPEKINSAAKVATGSYVGTGEFDSIKCELTFPFPPKLLIVYRDATISTTSIPTFMIATPEIQRAMIGTTSGNVSPIYVSFSGNTVSWSQGQSAGSQLNYSGYTYAYIAIG